MQCPDCGSSTRNKACSCGWRGEGGKKKSLKCAWVENGSRCEMLGTVSPTPSPDSRFYCLWHFECFNNPQANSYFEEFQNWVETVKELQSSKHQFSNGTAVELWNRVQGMGNRILKQERGQNGDGW